MHNKKIIIIGGGLSGLASAALMAKKGHRVTLFEKNNSLGGRARMLKKKGFQFDMGPSWYMMPEIFERFFAHFGKKTSDFYELVRLDPSYKVFFEEKEPITIPSDLTKVIKIFETIEKGAGNKLKKYLGETKQQYERITKKVLYHDPSQLGSWLSFANLIDAAIILIKKTFFQKWSTQISSMFKDNRLFQIIGFPSVFLGSSPYRMPALFSILSWADFGKGIWYPKGGMIKVVEALESLAKQHGVEIVLHADVTKLNVKKGICTGVIVNGKTYHADYVIAATDLAHVETQLIEKKFQSYSASYWQKKTLAISAVLIYLGLDKRIPQAVHHSLYFSNDWQQNFDDIFKQQILPSQPSFYISTRSVTDRSIVPQNAEELFVLIPVPPKVGVKKEEYVALANKTIKKIEKLFGLEIAKHIVVKEIYTPDDFASDYHAYQGTALGLEHTLSQSLFFRPGNLSKKISNLYYAGQYTNPGVGVPMALVSAEIVENLISKDKNHLRHPACPEESGGRSSLIQKNKLTSDVNIQDLFQGNLSKTTTSAAFEKSIKNKKEIFKKGSTTFFYSSLFFPKLIREEVSTLYAYVRIVDDAVDNIIPDMELFHQLKKQTKLAWSGKTTDHQIVQNFIHLAKKRKFEWEWIEAFLDAMGQDLVKKTYHTFEELEHYMYGSAEVVGLMMSRILGLPKEAETAAQLQGKAMQLINFIRDVDEDAALGRTYLPKLKHRSAGKSGEWQKIVRNAIEKYHSIQKQAEEGYKYLPYRYLTPIKTAAHMYNWTAQQILNNPEIVWQKKVKPSKWRVMGTAVRLAVIDSYGRLKDIRYSWQSKL